MYPGNYKQMRCFLFLIKLTKSQLRFIRYIRYISLYEQQTRQNSTVFLYTFQLEIRLTLKRFVLKKAAKGLARDVFSDS